MKKIFVFLLFFLAIVLINLSSSDSCCFYSSNGICSEGISSVVCSNGGGTVLGSRCNYSSECSLGCCVLGFGTKYITRRQCEVEAASKGFQTEWRQMTEAECSSSVSSTIFGACVFNHDFCTYTKKENCRGTDKKFHEGKLCSDFSLGTRCNKTEKTKCFDDGNVYYVDSCGNRDALFQECKYSEGFICKQNSSKIAYCKSLNCGDKKNGESWCVGLWGEGLVGGKPIAHSFEHHERPPVGSGYFIQRCLDGEILTEPCSSFREEICVKNENNAKCVSNKYATCFNANLESPDETGSKIDKESCDPEFCNVFDPSEEYEEEDSVMIKELGIEMCVPKIKPGQKFWDINREESFCSLGNFETKISFGREFRSGDDKFWLKIEQGKNYGNAGILNQRAKQWKDRFDSYEDYTLIHDNYPDPFRIYKLPNMKVITPMAYAGWEGMFSYADTLFGGTNKEILLNGDIVKLLKKRCKLIGDCAAEFNWIGKEVGSIDVWGKGFITIDPEEGIFLSNCRLKDKKNAECFFRLNCIPWNAEKGDSDCSKCGMDGLPCLEYRCKALGKNCEYKEPRGIDRGVCVSSKDLLGPSISILQDPTNPIPPYSPVKISITTDEDSYCKFDFKSGGINIDNMKYETDSKFGRTHEFILTAPRSAIDDEDIKAFPLLTRDGKYEVFIMCEDGAGNLNQKTHILEVMKAPDEIPPSILEFVPQSNSFVEFNKTTKRIKFRLNEPAECRWDFEAGKAYDEVGLDIEKNEEGEKTYIYRNNFNCDKEINEETTVNGYWCEGNLYNITTTIGNSTKFYIKCKDQPWLEGKEDQYYKRNENPRAFEYILKPSLALEIVDFIPNGNHIIGSNKKNISIQLKTKDGAERGKAECKWRLKANNISSGWKFFNRTNSSTHTDVILNIEEEGLYRVDVSCSDIAKNKVNNSYELNVLVDQSPPKLLRVYNYRGDLIFVLDEKAFCKFLNYLGCSFVLQNGTSMNNVKDNQFTTNLKKGNPYYIRCEDVFGNSACYENIVFY